MYEFTKKRNVANIVKRPRREYVASNKKQRKYKQEHLTENQNIMLATAGNPITKILVSGRQAFSKNDV